MLELNVQYLVDGLEPISKIAIGDWIDLRASEDIEIKQGESLMIPLGIKIALPDGYEALLVPRSSTFKNYGIIQTNSIGVIDNSYLGEWKMPVYAIRDTKIHKNERICQFRVLKNQPELIIKEVQDLSSRETARGTGGFGSTGKV